MYEACSTYLSHSLGLMSFLNASFRQYHPPYRQVEEQIHKAKNTIVSKYIKSNGNSHIANYHRDKMSYFARSKQMMLPIRENAFLNPNHLNRV